VQPCLFRPARLLALTATACVAEGQPARTIQSPGERISPDSLKVKPIPDSSSIMADLCFFDPIMDLGDGSDLLDETARVSEAGGTDGDLLGASLAECGIDLEHAGGDHTNIDMNCLDGDNNGWNANVDLNSAEALLESILTDNEVAMDNSNGAASSTAESVFSDASSDSGCSLDQLASVASPPPLPAPITATVQKAPVQAAKIVKPIQIVTTSVQPRTSASGDSKLRPIRILGPGSSSTSTSGQPIRIVTTGLKNANGGTPLSVQTAGTTTIVLPVVNLKQAQAQLVSHPNDEMHSSFHCFHVDKNGLSLKDFFSFAGRQGKIRHVGDHSRIFFFDDHNNDFIPAYAETTQNIGFEQFWRLQRG